MPSSEITVLLGPTNTGKTHYAIERLLGHETGMIGFPLRLLARENYDRMVARVGAARVALITGEEKIIPPQARWFCCTVEAMPLDKQVQCLAIDEVQLAGDRERGHVFTDRILHSRGQYETLFMGAETARPLLKKLLPEARFESRARFSRLSYAGQRKVTRLPRRSAIVAFSASEVYQLAELVRRQRGGAAVVMGALSPRTRNAQVELYQSGDVDFLIATDAIGMGLNMDITHVALAAETKFDGRHIRQLTAAELAQIAGRAGRHTTDGSFGVTEAARPLEQEMIEAIESHQFPPLRQFYWRSRALDFDRLDGLLKSLDAPPPYPFLARKGDAVDQQSLSQLADQAEVRGLADSPGRVRLLWEVAQIPDFRQSLTDSHINMLARIFADLAKNGVLDRRWVAAQMTRLDRLDGDIDTLMARLAHIRTWTYITHRGGWTDSGSEWPALARAMEDRVSDELHNRLTQRFVDRRAAHLIRRMKEAENLIASVRMDGTVLVEGEEVGTLSGFRFAPALADSEETRMILAAARKALPDEIERRVKAVQASADAAFTIDAKGQLHWREAIIARLVKSDSLYAPRVEVADSDLLSPEQKQRMAERMQGFIAAHIAALLGPLLALADPQPVAGMEPISGSGRGILWQIHEGLGARPRFQLAAALKELPETDKPLLARAGVRLGTETVYMPDMLKPAPIALRAVLWSLWNGDWPEAGPPPEGRVSFEASSTPDEFWLSCGYRRFGDKVMRVDMVERVAALVRAAAREGDFTISDEMLSLAGASHATMALMLADLGFEKVGERPAEAAEPAAPETEAAEAAAEEKAAAEAAEAAEADKPEKPDTEQAEAAAEEKAAAEAAEAAEANRPEKPPVPVFRRKPRPQRGKSGSAGRAKQGRDQSRDQTGNQAGNQTGDRSGDQKRAGNRGQRPDGRGSSGRGNNGRGGRPADRQPDPASPFAILAQLKK